MHYSPEMFWRVIVLLKCILIKTAVCDILMPYLLSLNYLKRLFLFTCSLEIQVPDSFKIIYFKNITQMFQRFIIFKFLVVHFRSNFISVYFI